MKFKRFSIAILLSASLTAFATAQLYSHERSKTHKSSDTSLVKDAHQKIIKARYTCPMHPDVISNKPGKCPKCGMTLVKAKSLPSFKKSHKMQKDNTTDRSKNMQ